MSDLKLAVEITADQASAVKGVLDLASKVEGLGKDLAAAQAESDRLGMAWEQAGGKADHLGIQIALAKQALREMSEQGVSKSHADYQALAGEIQINEAALKRLLPSVKDAEKAYLQSSSAAALLEAQLTRQSARLTEGKAALQAAGIDAGNLAKEYDRLSAEAQQAASELDRLAQEAKKTASFEMARNAFGLVDVEKEAKRLTEAFELLKDSGKLSEEQLAEAATRLNARLADLTGETRRNEAAARETAQIRANLAKILQEESRQAQQAAEAERALDQAFQLLGIRNTEAEVAKLRKAYILLEQSGKASAAQLAQAQANLNAKIGELNTEVPKAAGRFESMGRSIAGAVAALGLFKGAKALLETAASFDRIDAVLKNVTGDSKRAAREFEFVKDTAARLGLDLASTANAYAQLAASAKGTALEGEQTRRIFAAVANAMARTGGSAAETEGALQAIGQMMSKGNVQAEELRGQLGERLPGAFGLAAKAMGVSNQELNKMLDNGEVMASDLLPKLATALDNSFGDGNVNTLKANLNRLETAWTNLKKAAADASDVKGLVQYLTDSQDLLATEITASNGVLNLFSIIKTSVADTQEGLQKQHDALVKLKGVMTDAGWAQYSDTLVLVNQALAKLEAQEGKTAEATDSAKQAANDAKLADEQRAAGLKKLANEAESALKVQENETKTLQDGSQAREAVLASQLANTEQSIREAESVGRHAQALALEKDALRQAGELTQARIGHARAMVTASQAETDAAEKYLQALQDLANADGKLSDKEQESITKAQADVAAKRKQTQAAEEHLAALLRFPEVLKQAETAQAQQSQAVRESLAEAKRAVAALAEQKEASANGTGSTEKMEAAQEAAAVAVAKLSEALKTNTADTKDQSSSQKENAKVSADTASQRAAVAARARAEAQAQHEDDARKIHDNEQVISGYMEYANAIATFGEKASAQFDKVMKQWDIFNGANTDEAWFGPLRWADQYIKKLQDQQAWVDGLTAALQKATTSGEGLQKAIAAASDVTTDLGEQQLAGLRAALEQARQQMKAMADEARNTRDSLQGQLYSAQGNEAAAQALQDNQTLAGLEEKLNMARKAGNREAIRDLEASITLAKQLHQIRMDGIAQESQAALEAARKQGEEAAAQFRKAADEASAAAGKAAADAGQAFRQGMAAARKAAADAGKAAASELRKALDSAGQATKAAIDKVSDASAASLTSAATELDKAVASASAKAQEAARTILQAAAKSAQDAVSTLTDSLRQIRTALRDANAGIDDQIRTLSRAGFTAEEQRIDKIKELREKQAEAQKALAEGDIQHAQSLNQQVVRLAQDLSQETRDAAGNVVVGQQAAATQAIGFLHEAQSLNAQISAGSEAQARSAFQSRLDGIEQEKQASLAATAAEQAAAEAAATQTYQAKLADIEAERQAKLEAIRQALAEDQAAANAAHMDKIQQIEAERQASLKAVADAHSARLAAIAAEKAAALQSAQAAQAAAQQAAQAAAQAAQQQVRAVQQQVQAAQAIYTPAPSQPRVMTFGNSGGGSSSSSGGGMMTTKPRAYATGGWVGGSGTADNQLILATPDEFVVRPGPAKRFAGLLESLNAGQIPDLGQAAAGAASRLPSLSSAPSAGAGSASEHIAIDLTMGKATATGIFPQGPDLAAIIAGLKTAGRVA